MAMNFCLRMSTVRFAVENKKKYFIKSDNCENELCMIWLLHNNQSGCFSLVIVRLDVLVASGLPPSTTNSIYKHSPLPTNTHLHKCVPDVTRGIATLDCWNHIKSLLLTMNVIHMGYISSTVSVSRLRNSHHHNHHHRQ
jgi:hypothetical protein